MSREFSLTVDGTTYSIVVDGNSVVVNGQPFVVGVESDGTKVLVNNVPYEIQIEGDRAIAGGIVHQFRVEGLSEHQAGPQATPTGTANEGAVTAIMPGKIIRVLVAAGEEVDEGAVVCILEAMKMENELKAPMAGRVKALYVQPGQDVERGSVLAEIE